MNIEKKENTKKRENGRVEEKWKGRQSGKRYGKNMESEKQR